MPTHDPNVDWNVSLTGSNVEVANLGVLPSKAVMLAVSGGATGRFLSSPYAISDGNSGASLLGSHNMLYNGNTYDYARANTQGTLLASAARTATATAPNQTNYNARGVHVTLNVASVPGSGVVGLRVLIYGVDPVSGNTIRLNPAPADITAVGRYTYELYPGVSGTSGDIPQRTSGTLPRTWFAQVLHDDGGSYTYSLGYSLIL